MQKQLYEAPSYYPPPQEVYKGGVTNRMLAGWPYIKPPFPFYIKLAFAFGFHLVCTRFQVSTRSLVAVGP